MPSDYEDLFDLDAMDDAEIADLVRQELEENPELDPDTVDVQVEDGFVRLAGRVGTEQELQQIEHLVTDVLGIANYSNDLVVDELTRGERADAADEAVAEDDAVDAQLGEGGELTEPSAEHLIEDTEGDAYGTHDVQKAIEQGQSYNPPDRPTQEGSWSEENH